MTDKDVHAGYEFEGGMFSRVRSWVDLFPCVRLFRVLRLLASPVYISCTLLALILTAIACNLLGTSIPFLMPTSLSSPPLSAIQWWRLPGGFGHSVLPTEPASIKGGWTERILFFVGMLLIWTPAFQLAARAGASLTADRGLPKIGQSIRIAARRLGYSYLVPITMMLAIGAALLALVLLSMPGFAASVPPFRTVVGWIVGAGAIPVGLMIFGASIAIPFGYVAMICEKDPDPIDSLSRGFEYLFRRPLQLAGYTMLSTLIVSAILWIYGGVFESAKTALLVTPGSLQNDGAFRLATLQSIRCFVTAWLLTLAFGLMGGMYLLLRRDAGGQDIEDFWEPVPSPKTSLPELPPQAYEP
ncbi:hypothetical protein LOC67_21135 [Stieleria sp. JC731]|uniref:hypothetical protein n=1 Tax=Stieleria sp. JC731 TaxID=2894195 RepID=UPI001E3EBA90|nr:hypothetical protein [Stieleria sp. JC731]MCC9603061.1 hypothetical protein [Stieleria sp. JC731]